MNIAVKLAKKGNFILVKSDYADRETVLKYLKGARWHKGLKVWCAPATISTYRNLLKFCPEVMKGDFLQPQLEEWVNYVKRLASRLRSLQEDKVDDIKFPEGFVLTTPPFKHQRQAVAFCINLAKSALWLDLGLGKTYTSILIARLRHFKGNIKKVIVLCPLSLIDQWEEEILKYSEKGKCSVFKINDGSGTARKNAVDQFVGYRSDSKLAYCIMTYESVKKFKPILSHNVDMFILDESTKIKNPTAVRTIATTELCNTIPYGIELTGLPYLGNPADLMSQFGALDYTVYGDNLWSFNNHYIEYFTAGFGRGIKGFKNMDELKSRAYYIAFSRNKEDCLDLLPKVYTVRKLPIYPEQADIYDGMSADLFTSVNVNGEQVDVKGTLARLEKMQQVLAGFVIDNSGTPQWIGSPKYQEMVDIVTSSRENFIIWAKHRCVLSKIRERLEEAGVRAIVYSEHKPADQTKYKKQFQEGLLKVMVCQIASESKGLQLTSVKPVNTIYLENDLNVDYRWQSESRCHRIGMTGTATYIDLVTADTLDEGIHDAVTQKINIAKYIAIYGLEGLVRKGGLVYKPKVKTRRKKKTDEPEYTKEDVKTLVDAGIEGIEDLL